MMRSCWVWGRRLEWMYGGESEMGTCVCVCVSFGCSCAHAFVCVCVGRCGRVCMCVWEVDVCVCVRDAKIRIVIVLRRFAWMFVPQVFVTVTSTLHFSVKILCHMLKVFTTPEELSVVNTRYSVSDYVTSLQFFQWHEYTSLSLSDRFVQFMSHIQFVTNAVLLVAFCLEYSSTRSRVYFYPTPSCALLLSDNLTHTTTASHLHSLLTFSIQYTLCWWWQVFISCWAVRQRMILQSRYHKMMMMRFLLFTKYFSSAMWD